MGGSYPACDRDVRRERLPFDGYDSNAQGYLRKKGRTFGSGRKNAKRDDLVERGRMISSERRTIAG